MRLRAHKLVCLFLLVSALGAGAAAAAPARCTETYLQALFARGADTTAGSSTPTTVESFHSGNATADALTGTQRDLFRAAPAMHPPAAQAASVHTATSFARA